MRSKPRLNAVKMARVNVSTRRIETAPKSDSTYSATSSAPAATAGRTWRSVTRGERPPGAAARASGRPPPAPGRRRPARRRPAGRRTGRSTASAPARRPRTRRSRPRWRSRRSRRRRSARPAAARRARRRPAGRAGRCGCTRNAAPTPSTTQRGGHDGGQREAARGEHGRPGAVNSSSAIRGQPGLAGAHRQVDQRQQGDRHGGRPRPASARHAGRERAAAARTAGAAAGADPVRRSPASLIIATVASSVSRSLRSIVGGVERVQRGQTPARWPRRRPAGTRRSAAAK